MFDQIGQLQQMRQVAQDPASSEYVQSLVEIITSYEYRILDATEELHDAAEVEGLEVGKTKDERQEQLLAFVDAMASGNLREWWFTEAVADNLDNPEDAMAYAGLSEEEWDEQIDNWASNYREKAGEEFEQHSNEDIARLHVERKFGISLREFEREVVNWSRRRTVRTILGGNFEAAEQGIRAATAALEGEDGGDSA